MLFEGQFYTEVGRLSDDGQMRMMLLRGGQGQLLIYKEVERGAAEIFRRLMHQPHPNIVTIYGLKAVDEGRCGIFMEYVPSDTLDDRILQQGTIPLKEAKKIMLQLCHAVWHFHRLGIIHRDLKPMNILVTAEGQVKVTDFGIARLYRKDAICDTHILGTAGYAAPEQFGFSQTDEKADIYALGVILNRMLTGKMPGEMLYQGDGRIEAIIKACIRMSPSERCSLEELEMALGGSELCKPPIRKRILRHIPGFRTGSPVHMTLAIVGYIYMTLIFLIALLSVQGPIGILRWGAGYLIVTLGLGWFVGSFERVAHRLRMDRGVGKAILFLAYGFVSMMIFYAGVVIGS